MKLFKSFSCCNADSIQTIPSSSPYHESNNIIEERTPTKRKQDFTPKNSDLTDASRKSESPKKFFKAIQFSYDHFEEPTENSCSSDSVASTVADAGTIFQSKPKSSNELMAQNSFQVSTPGSLEHWGYPGHLSQHEYEVYVQFHNEACRRNEAFQQTIFSFGTDEAEEYALCRWLRARKFDLKRVIQMVEEATEYRAEAAKQGLFPDGSKALGVEKSIFFAIYPELFIGYSKHGYPFYITKAGEADLKTIWCITTMKSLTNFHWHCMAHALGDKLRHRASVDQSFHRFEAISIVDLEGISLANAMEAVNVLKEFTSIDQLCFPETLHRFIIINSPPAFAAVWRIIRTLIDPRTANKVEILARKPAWQSRLIDLVGSQQLPSDYGGTAPPVTETFEKLTKDEDALRQVTHPIFVRSAWSVVTHNLSLNNEYEVMELTVLTHSPKSGTFTIIERRDSEDIVVQVVEVKHSGTQEESPTRVTFPDVLQGPGNFQVRVNCSEGQGAFVLVGKVYDKNTIAHHHRMAACVVKAAERRYSNFALDSQQVEPKPGVEERQHELKGVISLHSLFPQLMDDQRPGFIRLKPTIIMVFTFFVLLMIHDYMLLWMISQRGRYLLNSLKDLDQ